MPGGVGEVVVAPIGQGQNMRQRGATVPSLGVTHDADRDTHRRPDVDTAGAADAQLVGSASLMTGACEVGALTGDPEFRAGLKEYGTYLGLAFQVTDDLLDYTETQMVLGKPTGQDLREHKMTLPLIAALPKMTSSERAQVESLMANPTPSDDLISSVRETVDLRGGISATRARAVTLARQAEARLDGLPPGPGLDALRACITYAIDRRN